MRKEISMGFGQAPSIVEKFNFFHTCSGRPKS